MTPRAPRASRLAPLLLALFVPGIASAATAVVTPLITKGVDAKVSTNVTGLIGSELDFSGAYETVKELPAAPSTLNSACLTSTSCLGGIAKANGADAVLAGSVGPGPAGMQVFLVLYDAGKNTIKSKQTFDVSGDPSSLADSAGGWVKAMITGQAPAAAAVAEAPPSFEDDEEDDFAFEGSKSSSSKSTKTRIETNVNPRELSDDDDGDFQMERSDPKAAAKAKADADAKAKAEATARAKADAEAKARAAAEAKAEAEAEARAQAKAEAERKAKADAARLAREDEEAQDRAREAARAKAEAARRARDEEDDAVERASASKASSSQSTASNDVDSDDLDDFQFGSSASAMVIETEGSDEDEAPPARASASSSRSSSSRTASAYDEDEDLADLDEDEPSRSRGYDEDEDLDEPSSRSSSSRSRSASFDEDEPPSRSSSSSRSSGSSKSSGSSSRSSSSSSRYSDLDEPRGSSRSSARIERDTRTGVALAGRVGYARYYDFNFLTYGAELSIPVAKVIQVIAGVEGFSTQRQLSENVVKELAAEQQVDPSEINASPWNTILPMNVGVLYKNTSRSVRPYAGLDLTLTPYTETFDLAVGARARAGADFMVAPSFGLNLNLSAGIMFGEKFEETQSGVKNFGLIPQVSAGTVFQF